MQISYLTVSGCLTIEYLKELTYTFEMLRCSAYIEIAKADTITVLYTSSFYTVL